MKPRVRGQKIPYVFRVIILTIKFVYYIYFPSVLSYVFLWGETQTPQDTRIIMQWILYVPVRTAKSCCFIALCSKPWTPTSWLRKVKKMTGVMHQVPWFRKQPPLLQQEEGTVVTGQNSEKSLGVKNFTSSLHLVVLFRDSNLKHFWQVNLFWV